MFEEAMSELGYSITDKEMALLETYYTNLSEWNKVMNLTAITDKQEVYEKHFLDSLSFVKAMPADWKLQSSLKLIDVGTGAGFPGLPIAIFYPTFQITLMDSLAKRIRFLDDTVEKLGISNIELIHSRAEDLARQKDHRENYDLCCSRAVANLSTLSEYCLPFIKQGGLFIAYKAEKAEQELESGKRAIEILGGQINKTVSFTLPGTEYNRTLIPILKIKNTPKKYPRKAGLPAKEPLC